MSKDCSPVTPEKVQGRIFEGAEESVVKVTVQWMIWITEEYPDLSVESVAAFVAKLPNELASKLAYFFAGFSDGETLKEVGKRLKGGQSREK